MRFKKIQPKGQLSIEFEKPWYPKKTKELKEMNLHEKVDFIYEVLGISKVNPSKDEVKDALEELDRIYKEKEAKLSEGWYNFNKPNE